MKNPQTTNNHRNDPSSANGWVTRILSQVELFTSKYAVSVLLCSLLLAGVSIWVTAYFLKFNASRLDLVSPDMKFVKLYKDFDAEFIGSGGMVVVVEGKNPEHMKQFTEDLAGRLGKDSAQFKHIFYKVDLEYFKNKGLLFLDMSELKDLGDKILAHRDFVEKINSNPGLNSLLNSINTEISSGMVNTLLADFLGDGSETEKKKDSRDDLSLLTSILKQISLSINGNASYESPWGSFLSNHRSSLKDSGYLVTDDESMMFVIIDPKQESGNFMGAEHAIDIVRKITTSLKPEYPDINVGLSGEQVIASDEMVTTQKDVIKASYLSLIGVSLVFIFAYKGIVKPLMAIFVLIIGLCWTMGFTTLTVGHLNILSVAFTSILVGLGIDFGIHIIERYREERRSGNGVNEALNNTIHRAGKGGLIGAVTTAIAFGSVTLTDFKGLAEWGFITSSGIVLCFIAMLVLLPSLIVIEERWIANSLSSPTKAYSRSLADRFFDHYQLIIVVCLALVVMALFSFKKVGFDYNLLHLQAKGTEAVEYELKIIENAKHSTWSAAIISSSLEESEKKLKLISALPTVGKVESILSLIPHQQNEKIEYIKTLAPYMDGLKVGPMTEPVSCLTLTKTLKRIVFKLRSRDGTEENGDSLGASINAAHGYAQKILKDIEKNDRHTCDQRLNDFAAKLFEDYREKIDLLKVAVHPTAVQVKDFPTSIKDRFIGKTGKFLITVFPGVNVWNREEMDSFMQQIRSVDPEATGDAVHMYESSRLMREGYIKAGIYATTAIIIYIFILYKNLRTTLLVLLPKFVGAIWTVGLMDLLGVQFNLANLVILPLILGIGVSNGIHIIQRYREENNTSDKNGNVLSKSTGHAVILSSVTTIIGFGSLIVANHQGIHSLGLVLAIGMGASLAASITLLPAMLKLCTVKGWKV